MRLALALLLVACFPLLAQTPAVKGLVLSEEEKGVLEKTNAERKVEGLPALVPSEKLFAAARGHSVNMAKQSKLEHTLDDLTVADRVKAAGYVYSRAGENIAWNQSTPDEVVRGWMNSPGHRANIMNGEYTEIGLAVAMNAQGERYWTQVFGKPR